MLMKKQWISAALILLLMLLIPIYACADVIYPAPDALVVGEPVNHLLATLDPGGTVWTDPALMPDGLYLDTAETEEGVNVYLRGTPTTPGTTPWSSSITTRRASAPSRSFRLRNRNRPPPFPFR